MKNYSPMLRKKRELELKTEINDTRKFSSKHIFHVAEYRTVHDIDYWIENGGSVDAKDNVNNTPLHYVAWKNPSVEVLKYFVSKGADIIAKNNYGNTPLHFAAEFNSKAEVLQSLTSLSVNVNAKRYYDGRTPLDVANTEDKRQVLRKAGGKSGVEL